LGLVSPAKEGGLWKKQPPRESKEALREVSPEEEKTQIKPREKARGGARVLETRWRGTSVKKHPLKSEHHLSHKSEERQGEYIAQTWTQKSRITLNQVHRKERQNHKNKRDPFNFDEDQLEMTSKQEVGWGAIIPPFADRLGRREGAKEEFVKSTLTSRPRHQPILSPWGKKKLAHLISIKERKKKKKGDRKCLPCLLLWNPSKASPFIGLWGLKEEHWSLDWD